MRLRGDLHKVDMVIAQMSLDHMQNPDLFVWSETMPCNQYQYNHSIMAVQAKIDATDVKTC